MKEAARNTPELRTYARRFKKEEELSPPEKIMRANMRVMAETNNAIHFADFLKTKQSKETITGINIV
jgi:hypothetical protein